VPSRIQVLSVRNALLHILCQCYCFCLLLLETQIVQFVQLEKLAVVFFSFLEHSAPDKLVFTHSSKCTNGYSELIYIDICRRHRRKKNPSSSYSDRIACETMRASGLLAVTNLCTHTNLNETTSLFQKESI